jgi:hypothetical protein
LSNSLSPLPSIQAAVQDSSASSESTACIVVGVLYVPVGDMTAFSHETILAQNGWSGNSRFSFDASPEDDSACGCGGLMLDMSGHVMRKTACSSSRGQKHCVEVTSSSWELAECGRLVTAQDIIHVTYTPRNSASVPRVKWGGWEGGCVLVSVDGIMGRFSCSGEVPEGHVAGVV